MLALIDADTPVVAAALSAAGDSLWKATSRLDRRIDSIIECSGCTNYILYVSGGINFRYSIDPRYKANRPLEEMEHRRECKEHLIKHWDARETNGYEADDAVGCAQKTDGSTIICGIDKDLLMVAGKHYQWPIVREGKEVRRPMFHDISEEQGLRTFFTQALTGDTNDNIGTWLDEDTGTWKKQPYLMGPKKAEKLLSEAKTEDEMYEIVKNVYPNEDRFINNLDLLWIWREVGITYNLRREIYG